VSARDTKADVCVVESGGLFSVHVRGVEIGHEMPVQGRPGNVAAAIAVALELGVPAHDVVGRLTTLPGAPHRLEETIGSGGVVVLDDTYNANPAGARAALAALGRLGADAKRRVVVTPGMVELGPLQSEENTEFAAAATTVATDLVIVGRTNRRALRRGARRPPAGAGAPRMVVVTTRPKATAWVREHLESGDVVLYENDLPDHYP
jgi:UDP-N-acetylmuramoyl-tripeptide--D-alanyl-D-alanine ligase